MMTKNVKRAALVLALILSLAIFASCDSVQRSGNRVTGGRDVQTFHYAYVYLGGQKIAEGYVDQWRDYKDSEAVQVQIGGRYYLTEYTNVVLVSDPSLGWTGYSDVSWHNIDE